MRSDATISRRSSSTSYISRTLPDASSLWPSSVAASLMPSKLATGVVVSPFLNAQNRRLSVAGAALRLLQLLDGHQAAGIDDLREAEAAVQLVGVGRPQEPALHPGEARVAEHGLHEQLAQPAAAVL